MKMKQYSSNGEDYGDLEQIFEELLEDGAEPGTQVKLIEGDAIRANHAEFIHGPHIIEMFQGNAYDNYGEYSEYYLGELTAEDSLELEDLIISWINKKCERPNFWKIHNEREYVTILEA